MVDRTLSIVIDRPLEEVFTYVTEAEKIPEWSPVVIDARQIPPGKIEVGTKIVQTVKTVISKTEVSWEIVAYEPKSLCRYAADSAYFTGEVTFSVEEAGGGTKFTVHDHGSPRGLLRLFEPLIRRADLNSRHKNLAAIKENLESQPA
jgi:uncharacterized protein YndB with AHSA1/START domain